VRYLAGADGGWRRAEGGWRCGLAAWPVTATRGEVSGVSLIPSAMAKLPRDASHLHHNTSPTHNTSRTSVHLTTTMQCWRCIATLSGLRRQVSRALTAPSMLPVWCGATSSDGPLASPPSCSVSVQGSATRGSPSKQPLQPCPLPAVLPSLPTHTHSRLTSERWCLRSEDPEGFFIIHLHSTVFSQVDFCSFSIFANIVDAMLEAVN
jgi:hypothetical protein